MISQFDSSLLQKRLFHTVRYDKVGISRYDNDAIMLAQS